MENRSPSLFAQTTRKLKLSESRLVKRVRLLNLTLFFVRIKNQVFLQPNSLLLILNPLLRQILPNHSRRFADLFAREIW